MSRRANVRSKSGRREKKASRYLRNAPTPSKSAFFSPPASIKTAPQENSRRTDDPCPTSMKCARISSVGSGEDGDGSIAAGALVPIATATNNDSHPRLQRVAARHPNQYSPLFIPIAAQMGRPIVWFDFTGHSDRCLSNRARYLGA